MRKLLTLLALLLLPTAAYAQGRPTAGRIMGGSGVPAGSCISTTTRTDVYIRTDINPHTLYVCSLGAWNLFASGGGGSWGSITGTLSSQADLQAVLDGKQPLDSDLTAIAALTPSNDDVIMRAAGVWTNRTVAQVKTTYALNNVDNTSDATKNAAVATLTNKTLTGPIISNNSALPSAALGKLGVDTDDLKLYYAKDGSTWGEVFVAGLSGPISVPNGGTGIASGTSGGVPYFSGSTTIASSAALTANLPVIGGGAGAAPAVGTRSGNTTQFVTTTGSQTSGRCVEIDANGNHIQSAAACGGSGGNGYTLRYMTITAANPADSTTYYAGLPIASGYGIQGTHDIARIPVVKTGTIKAVTIRVIVDSITATSENVAISLRLNNTTDTSLTATSQWTARVVDHLVTGLSIAVTAGDFIIIKIVTPAWATNPTDVSIAGDIYIE